MGWRKFTGIAFLFIFYPVVSAHAACPTWYGSPISWLFSSTEGFEEFSFEATRKQDVDSIEMSGTLPCNIEREDFLNATTGRFDGAVVEATSLSENSTVRGPDIWQGAILDVLDAVRPLDTWSASLIDGRLAVSGGMTRSATTRDRAMQALRVAAARHGWSHDAFDIAVPAMTHDDLEAMIAPQDLCSALQIGWDDATESWKIGGYARTPQVIADLKTALAEAGMDGSVDLQRVESIDRDHDAYCDVHRFPVQPNEATAGTLSFRDSADHTVINRDRVYTRGEPILVQLKSARPTGHLYAYAVFLGQGPSGESVDNAAVLLPFSASQASDGLARPETDLAQMGRTFDLDVRLSINEATPPDTTGQHSAGAAIAFERQDDSVLIVAIETVRPVHEEAFDLEADDYDYVQEKLIRQLLADPGNVLSIHTGVATPQAD